MRMQIRVSLSFTLTLALSLLGAASMFGQQAGTAANASASRPQGPCDIYAAAGDPCVAAHSTTRALYNAYDGPLYQVLRQSDGTSLNIGIVQPGASPSHDGGGYADAAAQDAFCANTSCWITTVYDQSAKHNDLTQPPRGGFSGPSMGGFNNLPIADMAPITIMGHKVYGVFIAPGMGLRNDDPKGTAVDDKAEGQYWVINGKHFNSGCCFDYGNSEIDSRDDDNGTMETTFFGDTTPWYHGNPPGPWVMTDQENNLVGCVNPDGSKLCKTLPSITYRFVTAMAKGEPHHWTSMGGDAQHGALAVMFSGPRVNSTYDPMRKQGAILLGNGGDNSNGSQGTFYEGAMTADGTFPADATDQLVQANVVSARYDVASLTLAPASAVATPPGLQTFSPGSSQETTVTFTNTTGSPITGLKLSLSLPSSQWSAVVAGTSDTSKTTPAAVAPGASVRANFKITSGPAAFNGDVVANASWTSSAHGGQQSASAAEKVRNAAQVKINEFRISDGPSANPTDSFIEIYNAADGPADLSNWTLTAHPAQQATFSEVKIPAGTTLGSHRFYLLGLANSGLAVPSRAGESTVYVRSTTGMTVGDTITIDDGSGVETRRITKLGTAATNHTTLWQPLPDGPVITIAPGASNVPVQSVAGLVAGEKIALGYGTKYPVVGRDLEQYEVATVTSVGKPGTQAYLAMDAPAGSTNIKVTSVSDITVGDKIRLDIDSVGHGIEIVTVTKVGKRAPLTNLSAEAGAGSTTIKVRSVADFAAGGTLNIGTPANQETVTISSIGSAGPTGTGISFTPALKAAHGNDETAVSPGTGLMLAAPLRFQHAANLPFSNRGTGVTFEPATAFAHASNEPVQALGSGIVLDRPLDHSHTIHAVIRDASVKTAGYQGAPQPNQWFGGPELTTYSPLFGRTIQVNEGSLILRDASGMVVDSLNYGGLVDPWAAEGYQAISGAGHGGCFAPAPAASTGFGAPAAADTTSRSAGRFPDGADTDSNCTDFLIQAATTLQAPSATGATNLKIAGVAGFDAGQPVRIGSGSELETAVIASVGTAGATAARSNIEAGTNVIQVASVIGFSESETITIDQGANAERAVVSSLRRSGQTGSITVAAPLSRAHATGAQIAGSGLTLTAPLVHAHATGAQVSGSAPPTPGAPNQYYRKRN